jgi:hypothetical protein
MPRGVWFFADPDPLRSGELRRLGVPALLAEADGWDNSFVHVDRATHQTEADLAVIPLAAINILPTVARRITSTILIEVDTGCIDAPTSVLTTLAGLQNRIAGVVARGPRAAFWAGRAVGSAVPVWTVPDAAIRAIELKAAAIRFDINMSRPRAADLPAEFGTNNSNSPNIRPNGEAKTLGGAATTASSSSSASATTPMASARNSSVWTAASASALLTVTPPGWLTSFDRRERRMTQVTLMRPSFLRWTD